MSELYRNIGLKISKHQEEVESIDYEALNRSMRIDIIELDKLLSHTQKWLEKARKQ